MSAATGTRLDGRAVAALTCGAAGLFLFNVVFGPIAIVLGAVAAHRAGSDRRNRAAGLVGIGLGVADLVVLAVLVAARIRGGTFGWHLG
jgi:Na+-driven multidrug efflux pump